MEWYSQTDSIRLITEQTEWKDKGKQEKLRAVCSIYPESITLLAADDAGITDFESLRGKIVNIGNPGSGNRGNAIETFKAYGMDWEKDIIAEELKPSECAKMLQGRQNWMLIFIL